MDDRFDASGFAAGLEVAGLRVEARREMGQQFAWFVARKPAGASS